MKRLKNHMSLYIAIPKQTHDFIEALAEKNGRTLASQIRIMLNKLVK
jgi:predicted DNA-binding protein